MKKLFQPLMVFMLLCVSAAYAQVPTQTPTQAPAPQPAAAPAAANAAANPAAAVTAASGLTPEEMNKPFEGSFFLTPLEITAIQRALGGRVMKASTLGAEGGAVIPAHRVIRVSGVLYRSPADWVVWMNNEKVTPGNLLPEIVDISVKSSSKVSLQWYDVGLNQVLSITLRPHQTYDITTGVLLPK
jgi:hypothetical protein